MSGWQVGDLALCVVGGNIGGIGNVSAFPEEGRIYQVAGTIIDDFQPTNKNGASVKMLGLVLVDGPQNIDGLPVWAAHRFRKIKPDTEGANEDDAAWLKDLLTKKVKA